MKADRRVRFNSEQFGFIVGFPDGEIVLAGPSAVECIGPTLAREELEPHLLKRLVVQPGFHLDTPPLVWLELTRRCDLACPHCYIDAGRRRPNEMSTERWRGILDELASMGTWAVAFTGGEPALHPDFAELVRYARSVGLLVGIASHGMLLSDEMLDSLPRDGVIISVSVDNLHVGRRGRHASTENSLAAIKRAQKLGFLTNVMANSNRENIDELAGMMAWAEENGVSVRSVPFSPIGRGGRNRHLENGPEDVEKAAQFWLRECEWEHEYHQRAGLCVGVIFNYGLTLANMTRRCSSGRYLCYVAADGTVFPCTMCASESLFSPGSVADRPFADLWRDHWEIRDYSWDNFAPACEGCVISDPSYYCASRCPAMSYARHGSFFSCGASEFEIRSTIRRTELLNASPLAGETALPAVVDARWNVG